MTHLKNLIEAKTRTSKGEHLSISMDQAKMLLGGQWKNIEKRAIAAAAKQAHGGKGMAHYKIKPGESFFEGAIFLIDFKNGALRINGGMTCVGQPGAGHMSDIVVSISLKVGNVLIEENGVNG